VVWTDGLIRYLRDLLYIKMGFSDDYFSLDVDSLGDRKTLAGGLTRDWLVVALETFNQTLNDLKSYSIPQLALELSVAKLIGGKEASEAKKSGGGDTDKPSGKSLATDRQVAVVAEPTEPVSDESPAELSADLVKERWREVFALVSKVNSSVGALVKSAKPVDVKGKTIVLEVSYKFHKERLESSTNLRIVEKILTEVFGCASSIRCIVCQKEGDLTDFNVRIPQNVVVDSKTIVFDKTVAFGKTNVIEVFDGGLPL